MCDHFNTLIAVRLHVFKREFWWFQSRDSLIVIWSQDVEKVIFNSLFLCPVWRVWSLCEMVELFFPSVWFSGMLFRSDFLITDFRYCNVCGLFCITKLLFSATKCFIPIPNLFKTFINCLKLCGIFYYTGASGGACAGMFCGTPSLNTMTFLKANFMWALPWPHICARWIWPKHVCFWYTFDTCCLWYMLLFDACYFWYMLRLIHVTFDTCYSLIHVMFWYMFYMLLFDTCYFLIHVIFS